MGCNNKMRWIDQCDGYYLTVDDDITYPADYVKRMVAAVDRYDGKAIVVVHGNTFLPALPEGPIVPDNDNKIITMYNAAVEYDTQVHLGGMGTGIQVPKIIGADWSLFSDEKNSGDDEKIAMYCSMNNIPIYALKRGRYWLKSMRIPGYKLCTDRKSRSDRIDMLRKIPWKKLEQKTMNICYITDGNDESEKELAVSLMSLFSNCSIPVSVYILSTGVSDNFKRCIQCLKKSFNAKITMIPLSKEHIEKCLEYNKPTTDMGKATATSIALTKFEIANLLPEEIKTVLYLDTDILVAESLEYFADLSSNIDELPELCAVGEKGTIKIDYEKQPYHRHEDYFNSGVLLMNLVKFREQNLSEQLWDAKKKCLDQRLSDQNAFNMVFYQRVKLLPVKYNAVCYRSQDADSVLFHYCGNTKPLKNPGARYSDKWMKYWSVMKRFFKNDEDIAALTLSKLPMNPKPVLIKSKQSSFSFDDNGSQKHDAVFLLGIGSKNKDSELLLAVHSMRKFCPFIDRIFIIGAKPRCKLDKYDVKHIYCDDPYRTNKDANMMNKVMFAITKIKDLSENFLLCSDDQVVTQECTWNDFKPKYVKTFCAEDAIFAKANPKDTTKWINRLYRTLLAYQDLGKQPYIYEPHIWSPVNKESFKKMIGQIKGVRYAGVIKSQYYNSIDGLDQELVHDHCFLTKTQPSWKTLFSNPPKFLSYNDGAFGDESFRKGLALLLR